MDSAILANMLYVPSHLVRTEHLSQYTYKIQQTANTPQDHLPPTCQNCQSWGLQWRKGGQTCADAGYGLNDTCKQYRPKSLRVVQDIEVQTWAERNGVYAFPRGDLGKLDRVFRDIPITDTRVSPPLDFDLQLKEGRVLRPEQQAVLDQWMRCGYGVVQAPTGWGKSLLLCAILAATKTRTIILADKTRHVQVVLESLAEHTNIRDLEFETRTPLYGVLGEDVRFHPNGDRYSVPKFGKLYPITIATYQSLTSKRGKELLPTLRGHFGMVYHEEAHHEAAATFHDVTKSFNPKYRGGQTATPTRGDKMEIVLYDTIGPVTARATTATLTPRAQFIQTHVPVPDRCFRGQYAMPQVETFLAGSKDYFDAVMKIVREDVTAGRRILIFSKRKSFNRKMAVAGKVMGIKVEVIDGDTKKPKEQSWYAEQLLNGGIHVIVGTTVIQENYNIPPLDCLHLPFPNFTKETELQIVGRIIRSNVENKPQPLIRVYGWSATNKVADTALYWRRNLYKGLGYEFDEDRSLGESRLDAMMREF